MVCGLLEFEILEVMMTAEDMVKVVGSGVETKEEVAIVTEEGAELWECRERWTS